MQMFQSRYLDYRTHCLGSIILLQDSDPHLNYMEHIYSELGTFEWWILGLMIDPIFFLITRLNNACSPLVINLLIN